MSIASVISVYCCITETCHWLWWAVFVFMRTASLGREANSWRYFADILDNGGISWVHCCNEESIIQPFVKNHCTCTKVCQWTAVWGISGRHLFLTTFETISVVP